MLGFGAISELPISSLPVASSGSAVGRLKYWDGVSWTVKTLEYWDGSAWQTKTLKYWDGGSWLS